jgi:type II secretory pathway component GspD/PulD (secretin)
MISYYIRFRKITACTAVFLLFLFISGCGDFFAETPTELESQRILRQLNTIEIPDTTPETPQTLDLPQKIVKQVVGGGEEYKLFYVCKYHTAEELGKLVDDQFAAKLFDKKGKSTQLKDYTVSINPATNQLIVRCPLKEDIDAVVEFLQNVDVPPKQIKIDCLISEVYADVTMDWETTLKINEIFGTNISLGGKTSDDGSLLPAFPGAALRDAARSSFGLKVGYVRNDDFKALVDLLVSRGYLKVLMNPSLEVVNGKTGEILISERVPLDQITTVTRDGFLVTETDYIDVVDSLKITPHVFADDYIGLETTALIGSKSTPEGVKQVPIVTKRQINNQENRIRQGQSLVIGGIRKTEKRSVVRGVPFLKDIPILGVLFSSKDFEERGKEVLFIITPSVSTGGIATEKMIDDLRKTHSNTRYQRGLEDVLLDPLGGNNNKNSKYRYNGHHPYNNTENVTPEQETIPGKTNKIQSNEEDLQIEDKLNTIRSELDQIQKILGSEE